MPTAPPPALSSGLPGGCKAYALARSHCGPRRLPPNSRRRRPALPAQTWRPPPQARPADPRRAP
eukprot:5247125-Alexandrium_andersonii.AAC.1